MFSTMAVMHFAFAYLLLLVVPTNGSPIVRMLQMIDRIVNGEDAVQGAHPHQVSLQWIFLGNWYHVCGGSVIDKTVILTAAHCVDFAPAGEFRVVINDHRLFDPDGKEQAISVKRIHMHQEYIPGLDYDLSVFPNDIAILLLANDVTDTSTIIPLATYENENFAGDICTISGWGLNDTDGVIPNTLQEVNMTVLNNTYCSFYWGYNIFQGQICIFNGEDAETGASSCSGDSGGPLVCNGLLAGVTSWGILGCRDSDTKQFLPSVYARVSFYYPWIQTILGRHAIGRG